MKCSGLMWHCKSVLPITPTCNPEGWIAKGAAQTGSAKRIWKAPQAAAKRSWIIPEQSIQARCFSLGVDFGEGAKTEFPEKNPQVRLRWTETQSTYNRGGGRRKCRIQRQPYYRYLHNVALRYMLPSRRLRGVGVVLRLMGVVRLSVGEGVTPLLPSQLPGVNLISSKAISPL